MSTLASTTTAAQVCGNTEAFATDGRDFLTPKLSLQQISTDDDDSQGQNEAGKLDTTQVLPTKYINNVDNLVRVMQAMVGEKGTFQIEMRHTSYILRSPIKLDLKELLERVASQPELGSVDDSRRRMEHSLDQIVTSGKQTATG